MPPTLDDLAPQSTKRVTSSGERTGSIAIFDLPRLLVHEVRAPETQGDLGVITEMYDAVCRL